MATVAEGQTFRYDVFISYSSVDRPAAQALQRQLENLGRPFYRARPATRVFRDESNMSADPSLEKTITDALAGSRFLLVLGSPEAAASRWVGFELQWWKDHRRADEVLLGYTVGEEGWDSRARVARLLPPAAAGLFAEPRWVDVRFLREEARRRDPRLLDGAAQFAAPIRGRERDEIYSEHLRRERQLRRAQVILIVALLVIVAVLLGITVYALNQRNSATRETMAAQSRQLTAQAQSIADDQPELARQLLVQAWRLDRTGPVVGAVLQAPMLPRTITHEDPSQDVDFLPDGSAMVVTGPELLRLYDPGTTEVIGRLDMPGRAATSAAVSPEGKLLALARTDGIDLVDVTDPRAPKEVGRIETGQDPQRLTFDGGGKRLFDIEASGDVVILDVSEPAAASVVRRLPGAFPGNSAPEAPEGLAVDPAGGTLLSEGKAGEIAVWSLPSRGAPVKRKSLAADGELIAVNPAAGHLVATGSDTDRLIRLWDLADPAAPRLRSVVAGLNVSALAFSADGTTLAVGTGDGTVQLYDVTDPPRVTAGALLAGQTDRIDELAFSPDGRTLATNHRTIPDLNGVVRMWRLTGSRRSAAVTQLPSNVLAAPAFSPDGRLLIDGSPRTVWDVTVPARPDKRAIMPAVGIGSHAAAFGPDGRTIVTSLPPVVWDITGAEPRPLSPGRGAEPDSDVQMLFQPGRDVVAGADTLGEAALWDVSDPATPREIGRLPGSTGRPQGMAFRPDGAMLASVGGDGQAQLWDVSGAAVQPVGAIEIPSGANSVAWNADLLYVGDEKGNILVWNVAEPRRPRATGTYRRHIAAVGGLVVSPDGRLLASASSDGSVRLWESDPAGRLTEAAVLATGRPSFMPSLAFSPRGDLLAGQGQIWSVDAEAAVRLLCAESTPITADQWNQYLPARPYDPPCR